MADLPPSFLAERVAERGYLSDSAIDRDALRVRNVRVLVEQGATAVEVAALVGLPAAEVDAICLRDGVHPACPICGAPRARKTQGRRLKKTCGDPGCRTSLMARSNAGPRKPLTRVHRERIGQGIRKYWDAHPEGQPDNVRARISEGQRRRWARVKASGAVEEA